MSAESAVNRLLVECYLKFESIFAARQRGEAEEVDFSHLLSRIMEIFSMKMNTTDLTNTVRCLSLILHHETKPDRTGGERSIFFLRTKPV